MSLFLGNAHEYLEKERGLMPATYSQVVQGKNLIHIEMEKKRKGEREGRWEGGRETETKTKRNNLRELQVKRTKEFSVLFLGFFL